MPDEKTHDLYDFMQEISRDMAADYQRIHRQTTTNSDSDGEHGEKNWARLMREWLPRTYKVVTNGRIISKDGDLSPKVNVLVLNDIYPEKLIDKEIYLAAGVAAAFDCIVTLEQKHIQKAVKASVEIKNLYSEREGSPYKELHTPIVYGLLAHSHSWTDKKPLNEDNNEESTPEIYVEKILKDSDELHVLHPRLCPDVFCVADLATWISCKMTYVGPGVSRDYKSSSFSIYGPKGAALTSYVGYTNPRDDQIDDSESLLPKIITGTWPPTRPGSQVEHFTPIGGLISKLSRQLAWDNPALRDLADYYQSANIAGIGVGDFRAWESSIYSKNVRRRVVNGNMTSGKSATWDEWRQFFF